MIRISRLWLFAFTAVALAGCGTSSGTSDPQSSAQAVSSTSVPAASSAVPYAGAPKVSNPLPVSVLSGDPCADALTADQTKTIFGRVVAGGRSEGGALGPTCEWNTPDTGAFKADPCAVDLQVADMVIGNLRQQAGS